MAFPAIDIENFRNTYLDIGIGNGTAEIARFQSYIDRYVPIYRRKLLGNQAYAEIEAAAGTLRQKWQDLLTGCLYDDGKGYHPGTEEYVKMFVFFEWVRQNFTPTHTGNVKNKNENSVRLDNVENARVAISRYNDAVISYNEKTLSFLASWSNVSNDFLNVAFASPNMWSFSISPAKYLLSNDLIKIAGKEYNVEAVTVVTPDEIWSLNIETTDNLSNAETYSYSPFKNVPQNPTKLSSLV